MLYTSVSFSPADLKVLFKYTIQHPCWALIHRSLQLEKTCLSELWLKITFKIQYCFNFNYWHSSLVHLLETTWTLTARKLEEPSTLWSLLRRAMLLHPAEHLHWSLPKELSDSSEGGVKLCPPSLNMLREHSAFATGLNKYTSSCLIGLSESNLCLRHSLGSWDLNWTVKPC